MFFALKRLALVGTLAATAFNAHAISAGDLAFTAFNAQEDGFSMVALADIAANTTVYFSDNEWNGSAIGSGGAFNTGESFSQWASGGLGIAAGTVIRFNNVDSATLLGASVGSFSRATVSGSANWGVSTSADTVYAFIGTAANAPTAFLAAISSGNDGSLVNLGAGVNTIQLAAATLFSEYTGPRSGQATFAGYVPTLTAPGSWSTSVSSPAAAPNLAPFSVTAVPEPQTYAMLLAGLAAVGFIARRRAAR